MKNKLTFLTFAVILLNFVLVLANYNSLPEQIPLHYDLEGNYSDSMSRTTLLFYPVVSLALCSLIVLVSSVTLRKIKCLAGGREVRHVYIGVTTVCIALIILSSTCVTLTSGRNHFFMFAEPVIFMVAVAAVIIGEIRIRKAVR